MTMLLAGRGSSAAPYAMPSQAPWNAPTYCATPTPDDTGSALHPAVLDFGAAGWRGWRYWMAMTPYYNNTIELENPCILVSRDGYTWQEPSAGMNPVFPWPGTYWQSDTDLEYDPGTDQLVLIFRHRFQSRISRSSDGIVLGAPVPFDWPGVSEEQASPAIVRVSAGAWLAWTVQHPSRALYRWSATAPEGPWTGPEATTGDFAGNTDIWHLDVIHHDGAFRMIMAEGWTTGVLYTASSSDGLAWIRSETPLLTPGSGAGKWDNEELYRATLTPHEDNSHYRVWYAGRSTALSWRIGHTIVPRSLWPTVA